MSDSCTLPVNLAEIGPTLTAAVAFIWSSASLLQALAAGNADFQHLRIVECFPHGLPRRRNAPLARHVHENTTPCSARRTLPAGSEACNRPAPRAGRRVPRAHGQPVTTRRRRSRSR